MHVYVYIFWHMQGFLQDFTFFGGGSWRTLGGSSLGVGGYSPLVFTSGWIKIKWVKEFGGSNWFFLGGGESPPPPKGPAGNPDMVGLLLWSFMKLQAFMKSLWLLEASTCFRREDGLSCRHGVKPPLTPGCLSRPRWGSWRTAPRPSWTCGWTSTPRAARSWTRWTPCRGRTTGLTRPAAYGSWDRGYSTTRQGTGGTRPTSPSSWQTGGQTQVFTMTMML